jgi:hypothetical protein
VSIQLTVYLPHTAMYLSKLSVESHVHLQLCHIIIQMWLLMIPHMTEPHKAACIFWNTSLLVPLTLHYKVTPQTDTRHSNTALPSVFFYPEDGDGQFLETSIHFHHNVQHHIATDSNLHINCHKHTKCHMVWWTCRQVVSQAVSLSVQD